MSKTAQKSSFRIDLNLLHPKEVPAKLPERFLKWLISYGRFIVIFVEIIVVSAFLTRFKYDADLDELKKQINLDLPYIEGQALDEALIKQTHLRIQTIDKIYNQSPTQKETITNITSELPASVIFSGLNLDQQPDQKSITFKINGTTLSNVDLGIFINNLRASDHFSEVSLSSISFDQEFIVFTITGVTK